MSDEHETSEVPDHGAGSMPAAGQGIPPDAADPDPVVARVDLIVDLTRQRMGLALDGENSTNAVMKRIRERTHRSISIATIRNYRRGNYPTRAQFKKLEILEKWARQEYPTHPVIAGGSTLKELAQQQAREPARRDPRSAPPSEATGQIASATVSEDQTRPGLQPDEDATPEDRAQEEDRPLEPRTSFTPASLHGTVGPAWGTRLTPRRTLGALVGVVVAAAVVWALAHAFSADGNPSNRSGSGASGVVSEAELTFDSRGGGEGTIKVYPGVFDNPEDKQPSGTYNNGDTVRAICWADGREITSDVEAGETFFSSSTWIGFETAEGSIPRFATLAYASLDTDYRRLPPCEVERGVGDRPNP